LSKILHLFFSAPIALSTVTLGEECLRLNNSQSFEGRFLGPYSDKWYLTPLGRHEASSAAISCIYQVELTYNKPKSTPKDTSVQWVMIQVLKIRRQITFRHNKSIIPLKWHQLE
jgi:hypothetical protein